MWGSLLFWGLNLNIESRLKQCENFLCDVRVWEGAEDRLGGDAVQHELSWWRLCSWSSVSFAEGFRVTQ